MHLSCFSIFLKIWKNVCYIILPKMQSYLIYVYFLFFSIFQKKFHKSKNGHVQKDKTENFFEKIKG